MTDNTSTEETATTQSCGLGIVGKTIAATFLSVNLVAAAGSFQASNENHADPEATATEIAQNIFYRPADNFVRMAYGDYTSAKKWKNSQKIPHADDAIDAKFCRTLGNVFNREKSEHSYDVSFATFIASGISMFATLPGSYTGGLLGTAAGEIGIHLD